VTKQWQHAADDAQDFQGSRKKPLDQAAGFFFSAPSFSTRTSSLRMLKSLSA
jgi:hypothetical protein